MHIRTFETAAELSVVAAEEAASTLRTVISRRGSARLVAATGTSQIAFLDHLCRQPGIAWAEVELFHLDEYIGLPGNHPASFRRFLSERLIIPTGIRRAHLLDGDNPERSVREVGAAISSAPIDLAFAGIGENGHLAFNDPPADFATDEPFLVVSLDDACRRQQVGEGWFAAIDDVPTHAITMSVRQILKSERILCLASGTRKAEAVASAFTGEVRPAVPASILRQHPGALVYLDRSAAARLPQFS